MSLRTIALSLLAFIFSIITGCSSEGWPSGHVCDQDLPITFSGMLGMGIPNGDGTYAQMLGQACSQHDYDDDDVPAGGDVNDRVDEYDYNLEGEDEGWIAACIYVPPEGYDPYSVDREYDYNEGCRWYWRDRLEVHCAEYEQGTLRTAEGNMVFEDAAYTAYCLGEYIQ